MSAQSPSQEPYIDEILDQFLRNRNKHINANLARIDEVDLSREATKVATKEFKQALEAYITKREEAKQSIIDQLRFERDVLQDMYDNFTAWLVKHPDDSLDHFMRLHVSSFVYEDRQATLKAKQEEKS